jgi:hypothetical protein
VAGSNGRLKWAASAIAVTNQPATLAPIEAHQTSSILSAGEAAGSVNRDR